MIFNLLKEYALNRKSPWTVHHEKENARFTVEVEGQLCEVTYRLINNTMHINHTYVPPSLEGQGIAAAMVHAAIVWAQEQGYHVQPNCSYAYAYMQRHPEFLALMIGS